MATRGPDGKWAGWQKDPALRIRYVGVYRAVKDLGKPVPEVARAFGLKSRSQVYRIIEAVEASGILSQ